MNLLEISFAGAVFILAVAIIRAAAIHRLPKNTFLVLWEAVLLRLLIPFPIPSVFSVYTLIPYKFPLMQTLLEQAGFVRQGIPFGSSLMQASLEQADFVRQGISHRMYDPLFSSFYKAAAEPANSVVSQKPFTSMPGLNSLWAGSPSVSVWFLIWCAGMILLAVFFILSYLHCRMEFQTALPVSNAFTKQWLKEHPLKRQISIRQSDRISAPLTYGILCPVILMPKGTDWENISSLKYIFTHEYVHIRRFDALTKLFAALALCIHWFNPFVWLMYLLFNRDMELACDENVIRQFGEKSKADYSRMLICMEAEKSGLAPFSSSFSKNAAEERITAIMKTKRTTLAALLSACLMVFVMVSLFATSPIVSANGSLTPIPAIHEPQTNANAIVPDRKSSISIIHESADILYYENGDAYIHDILTNNTDKTITEIQYCMLAYKENGSPLKLHWYFMDSSSDGSFENIVRTKKNILPDETEEYSGGWSLYHNKITEDFPKVMYTEAYQASYVLICLKQVVFEDGSFWNNPDYESWFQTYWGQEIEVEELQNYYPQEYTLRVTH